MHARLDRRYRNKISYSKRGSGGSLLLLRKVLIGFQAILFVMSVDPTGAGDTFAGGFMGYLASTDDITFDNLTSEYFGNL